MNKVDLKTIDLRRNRIPHDYLNTKLYVAKDDKKDAVFYNRIEMPLHRVLSVKSVLTQPRL